MAWLAILIRFFTVIIEASHDFDVPCNLALIRPKPYFTFPWPNYP